MAPTEAECRRIVNAAKANGILFGVCHVLRYTPYSKKVKEILDAGLIGEIVNIQHLEPVGYWHQAHSFVRGNWRNEAQSSFMLLAKSSHDLDWIRYMMGVPCQKVASFGFLKHFRAENKPEGAADRCVDCAVEPTCPYSAKKIYWDLYEKEKDLKIGFTFFLTPGVDRTEEAVREGIRTGPYGRCVYACDNDVVDNQVVNMSFEGSRTATFTMTAFTNTIHRQTRIFGTRGQLIGDGSKIEIGDFLTDRTEVVDTEASDGAITGGHGGGDVALIEHFVDALVNNDQSCILSGPDETLESHLMVFGAEKSRLENCVVDITT